jgi:flavin reductase (DIM6/NTAB) family NADH-FMN oxidoreductase RutF
MYFDPRENLRPAPLTHNPLNALVAPRPIGWIGTCDAQGVPNLAPFSYFNAVSADPPLVVFAPNEKSAGEGGRPASEKDTLANLREVPEFSASIVSEELAWNMNDTSTEVERQVDEYALAGLTAAPCRAIRPARVGQARAVLECEVVDIVALPSRAGGRRSHLVIGAVIGIHIDDALIVDGRVDVVALAQVARLGYLDYGVVRELFEMPRP